MKMNSNYIVILFLTCLVSGKLISQPVNSQKSANQLSKKAVIPKTSPSKANQQLSLKLEVEKNKIYPLGHVSFKASLSGTNQKANYIYQFGDGTKDDTTEFQTISHTYKKEGIYFAKAIAVIRFFNTARFIPDQYVSSNFDTITVDSIGLNVTPLSVMVGDTVQFNIDYSTTHKSVMYSIDFNDNTVSDLQQSPLFTHIFNTAGTYYVTGLVNFDARSSSHTVVREVLVNDLPPGNLLLHADSVRAYPGSRIRFTAESPAGNLQYQFFFGDGDSTVYQYQNFTFHQYRIPKIYTVFAKSIDNRGRIVNSDSISILIVSLLMEQKIEINLLGGKSIANEGDSLQIHSIVIPPQDGLQYKYFRGGYLLAGTNKPEDPIWINFPDTGKVPVEVKVYHNGQIIGSSSFIISIIPIPGIPWKILAAISMFLITAAIYFIRKRTASKKMEDILWSFEELKIAPGPGKLDISIDLKVEVTVPELILNSVKIQNDGKFISRIETL